MIRAIIVLGGMSLLYVGLWVWAKSEADRLSKEFGGDEDEGFEDRPESGEMGKEGA